MIMLNVKPALTLPTDINRLDVGRAGDIRGVSRRRAFGTRGSCDFDHCSRSSVKSQLASGTNLRGRGTRR